MRHTAIQQNPCLFCKQECREPCLIRFQGKRYYFCLNCEQRAREQGITGQELVRRVLYVTKGQAGIEWLSSHLGFTRYCRFCGQKRCYPSESCCFACQVYQDVSGNIGQLSSYKKKRYCCQCGSPLAQCACLFEQFHVGDWIAERRVQFKNAFGPLPIGPIESLHRGRATIGKWLQGNVEWGGVSVRLDEVIHAVAGDCLFRLKPAAAPSALLARATAHRAGWAEAQQEAEPLAAGRATPHPEQSAGAVPLEDCRLEGRFGGARTARHHRHCSLRRRQHPPGFAAPSRTAGRANQHRCPDEVPGARWTRRGPGLQCSSQGPAPTEPGAQSVSAIQHSPADRVVAASG